MISSVDSKNHELYELAAKACIYFGYINRGCFADQLLLKPNYLRDSFSVEILIDSRTIQQVFVLSCNVPDENLALEFHFERNSKAIDITIKRTSSKDRRLCRMELKTHDRTLLSIAEN